MRWLRRFFGFGGGLRKAGLEHVAEQPKDPGAPKGLIIGTAARARRPGETPPTWIDGPICPGKAGPVSTKCLPILSA